MLLARLTQGTTLLVCVPFLLSSCSHARKGKNQPSPLVAEVIGEPAPSDEKIAELKKIADSPNARLEEKNSEESDSILPPLDPSIAWKKGDFEPRSIHPGDVFFEQSGAILHKASSIEDTLANEEWQTVLASYGKEEKRLVPLTLSQEEIVEITTQTEGRIALPTRSVALDFRTLRQEIDPKKLESYFREISVSQSPSEAGANREVLSDSLAEVKSRMEQGEEFFVITSVTSSESLRATYPGAPVGRRDAELILNMLSTLYPHLDQLAAKQENGAIVVTRDPKIFWEFEASPLVLENGQIKIRNPDPGQLFSQRSFRNR